MQLSASDSVNTAVGVCNCLMVMLSKLWLVQLSGDDGVIKALGVCSCLVVMMALLQLLVCTTDLWWK